VSDPAFGGERIDATRGNGRRGAGSPGEAVPGGIAAAIADVSERATQLVREEIELAKAEVAEKATKLARGVVIGVAAGIFVLGALFFFSVGCAWLLYFYLPGSTYAYFWGFFAMAAILLILGVLAGAIAARAVKRGAPPTPDMAIEEARLIRETMSAAPPGAPAAADPSGASDTATPPAPVAPGPSAAPGSAPYGAAASHLPGSSEPPPEAAPPEAPPADAPPAEVAPGGAGAIQAAPADATPPDASPAEASQEPAAPAPSDATDPSTDDDERGSA
jgi:Putative Actinobacterial Holin-X, holin superfamily III